MTRGWTHRVNVIAALVVAAGASSCDSRNNFVPLEPSWERMLEQPRYDPYEASRFFADGRTMQAPPEGTVPRSRELLEPMVVHGFDHGAYAANIPYPLDRPLLELGRQRFETFCGTCHGLLGDGDSVVGRNMQRRHPPSLLDARIREAPVGRIFEVATEGYGFMPSYAARLDNRERWAVVAYIRALQRSQYARVDQLPPAITAELRREAP